MLKDITIGQHFPGNSAVHRIDARMKIIFIILFITMLFLANNFYGLCLCAIFVAALYFIANIAFKSVIKSIKPILPIIIFTAAINLFFYGGDNIIFSFWIIKVSYEGISFFAFMSIRLIAMIVGTSLLTYTTSPIELTDGIERLLNPLKKIKFPVHETDL